MSKCMFAYLKVEYLGHIIFGEGVKIDPKKILAMQEWPVPSIDCPFEEEFFFLGC